MKKKSFFISASISLCLFALFFTYLNFIKRTKGFSLKKITSYHTYNPKWEIGPLNEEQEALLDRIASQPFFHLGSGKECYAFVSEDSELVIKFFKQKHMHTHSILTMWPFSLSPYLKTLHEVKFQRRSHLRNQTFMSYWIGYNYFADRTGLLYLHLNQTKNLNRQIEITSLNGRKFLLDLDKMEFLIQKRADSVFDYLKALKSENKTKEAKQAIGSILDLVITRSNQGIFDSDNNCERNIGFMDGRASLIDVGEFRLSPSRYPLPEEFYSATEDLHQWLSENDPELKNFLELQIQKRLRSNS